MPVFMDKAFLNRVGFQLARRHTAKRLKIDIDVVRVCEIRPGFPNQFLAAVAEDPAERVIEFDPLSSLEGNPSHSHRRRLKDSPEACLTFAQPDFGGFPRRHIVVHFDDRKHLADMVVMEGPMTGYENLPPLFRVMLNFSVPGAFTAKRLLNVFQGHRKLGAQ
jgi:hypothetical protein